MLSFFKKSAIYMANHKQHMEDSDISKTEKSSSLIPALGLLGLGVGIIALALGVLAMVKVGDTAKSMDEKIEKAAALSLDMKKISDRIDSLAAQVNDIKGASSDKVDILAKQVQSAINEIFSQLNAVKGEIAEDRKAIESIAKRSPSASAPSEAATSQPTQSPDASSESGTSTKTYVIQPGDTFGKLAKKYNVSVDAIIQANPNANPSRLRIGQEIVIP